MAPQTPDRPLSDREQAFVSAKLQGASNDAARKAAGYSSSNTGLRLGNDERMRVALQAAAIDAGLSPMAAAHKLRALLDAERFELSRDGSAVPLGPDNRAQLGAVELLYKLMGGMPNPRIDVSAGNQQVVVIHASRDPLAALDPFSAPPVIEGETVGETVDLTGFHNPNGDIPIEDDFLIQ